MTKADLYKWVNFHNFERKYKKMTIINNEKIINTFENIEVGEIFQCENFGSTGTYMKIWEVVDRSNGDWYNAVCLDGGDLTMIKEYEKVSIFPKAKLILN